MLTVLVRLTLRKTKNKKIVSYFRGSVVLITLEHSRSDQIKRLVSRKLFSHCFSPDGHGLLSKLMIRFLRQTDSH
jgi:hypothetical protein